MRESESIGTRRSRKYGSSIPTTAQCWYTPIYGSPTGSTARSGFPPHWMHRSRWMMFLPDCRQTPPWLGHFQSKRLGATANLAQRDDARPATDSRPGSDTKILGDHLKTGHLLSVQNRPLCVGQTLIVLPRRSQSGQGA